MNYTLAKIRRIFWMAAAVLLLSVPGFAAEFQEDLRARRARVMERLSHESIMILWSAPVRVYSHDVHYKFRQDSNLYYLTGIDQQDTILVLMPGNHERKEILFVKPRDPVSEHWDGRILSREEAAEHSGIATVHLTTEFDSFIDAIFGGRPYNVPSTSQEFAAFMNALSNQRARLELLLDTRAGVSGVLPPDNPFLNDLREKFSGFVVNDVTSVLRELRQVKTAYEQKILEESARISSEAHMAGMRVAVPDAYEYEVEAMIEYVFRKNGALGWAYPSIVGSGPNATILHYNESSRRMEDGDLLLVDAAANYQYLTIDITRTYPINGTFTPAQREIYELVLQAQEEGMKAARAGARFRDINQAIVEVVKEGLLRLGLITDVSGNQYRIWYTHGACHWIGMDVHDWGDNDRSLAPGMAFVIEPGIYIREEALANLPITPENAAFIDRVRPAVEKFKDIGVRIEDSFLLTESGLQRLSSTVPRTVQEIEAFLRSR